MISPYNERKVHNSELLQVILLDSIYSTSGSQNVIFQGGTALRWIYSGMRFSEDLDFVTNLSISKIESILKKAFRKADRASILQFGPGTSEISRKKSRQGSIKLFYIFRSQEQKERIAVKIEFEPLKKSILPDTLKTVLRDLPAVSGLTAMGKLIMPYSSSIIISENPDELLSDKIRSLYERSYIKGRDIFDIWWLSVHMKISPSWDIVSKKLRMYLTDFSPKREPGFFLKEASRQSIINAQENDLPRFIDKTIYESYKDNNFKVFIDTLQKVVLELINQGMEFKKYE